MGKGPRLPVRAAGARVPGGDDVHTSGLWHSHVAGHGNTGVQSLTCSGRTATTRFSRQCCSPERPGSRCFVHRTRNTGDPVPSRNSLDSSRVLHGSVGGGRGRRRRQRSLALPSRGDRQSQGGQPLRCRTPGTHLRRAGGRCVRARGEDSVQHEAVGRRVHGHAEARTRERCTLVRQECLGWADPPGGVPQRTCAEFASPTVCEGPRRRMGYCTDRLEYTPPGFDLPLVHVSMAEAENLCSAQGKRLCDELEWELACEGRDALPFPYGYVRDGSGCNHDVGGELFPGGKLADRRVTSSSLERCVSPFGVQRLVGNVDEWCVRPGASPRSVLRGGWWLTGRNRCRAVTDSHGENYAGPQTGFRCCKAARGSTQ